MYALVLASLSAIPLAGTPTTLASNPQISARLSGLLSPSTTAPGSLGLRFAISNGSDVPVVLNVCSNALREQRLAVDRKKQQTIDSNVSFAMRLPDAGYQAEGCKPLALSPGATRDIDLFYRDVNTGSTRANGNRLTLATDQGNFVFVSSTLVPGGVDGVRPHYYPDRGSAQAAFPIRSQFYR